MKSLSLQPYSPIISDKKIGKRIYNEILELDPKENMVEIDMAGIISMTTYCAKQIFGKLYKELGPNLFEKNIILKKVSTDVLLIIKMGIKNAVLQQV
nr:STAS-like domain-containing protein [uncultured Prevotella sp.]